MKLCARIAAVVFIIVGMTSALTAQLSFASTPHEKPAGCHQRGKQSPVPERSDYKCCIAGHQTALPRSAAIVQVVGQVGVVVPLATPVLSEVFPLLISESPTPLDLSNTSLPLRV
jgi:hypothetical protein